MRWRITSQNFVEIKTFNVIKTSKDLTHIVCRRELLRKISCFLMFWNRFFTDDKLKHSKYEFRTTNFEHSSWFFNIEDCRLLFLMFHFVWSRIMSNEIKRQKMSSYSRWLETNVKKVKKRWCNQRARKSWQNAWRLTISQLICLKEHSLMKLLNNYFMFKICTNVLTFRIFTLWCNLWDFKSVNIRIISILS